jgi:hypothetical protein
MKRREIKSKHGVVGIKLEKRGDNDNHICIRFLGEDDEHWWETDVSFSSYWIDEYIKMLQAAKAVCEAQEPDIYEGRHCGWKFK